MGLTALTEDAPALMAVERSYHFATHPHPTTARDRMHRIAFVGWLFGRAIVPKARTTAHHVQADKQHAPRMTGARLEVLSARNTTRLELLPHARKTPTNERQT